MATREAVNDFLDKIHKFLSEPSGIYGTDNSVSYRSAGSAQEAAANVQLQQNENEHNVAVKQEAFTQKVAQFYASDSVVNLRGNGANNNIPGALDRFMGRTQSTYDIFHSGYTDAPSGNTVITVFGKRSDFSNGGGTLPFYFTETFLVDGNFIIKTHFFSELPFNGGDVRL